ncbi:MAG: hypothetical protein J6T31_06620 [Methanobrevibacter sp.]|nr:hypothetical protein [Methanobrevibacter sp.]
MLFAEINAEIEKYRVKSFTGHLKFGIEKSTIVSLTVNSRLEKSDRENDNYDKLLMELCSAPNFFGSIEFDLILGEVQRLNYCMSYNGQSLKDKLGKEKMGGN